jgi:hypothetical protein
MPSIDFNLCNGTMIVPTCMQEADRILCDFLDAVGYAEISCEFRKIHEIYPTVAPRYSKPSWRL